MRKLKAPKRPKLPDPIYQSVLVEQLMQQIMAKGKKNLAQRIIYQTLTIIKKTTKKDPLIVLNAALENIKPKLEIKSRKVGGARYQIPIVVKEDRQVTLALRWLVTAAKKRTEKSFILKLVGEIQSASKKAGGAVKKKETIHKMAEANKAFAYYSW